MHKDIGDRDQHGLQRAVAGLPDGSYVGRDRGGDASAAGTIVFFEKMFEGRMFFTDNLMRMGANIVFATRTGLWCTGRRSFMRRR